jgi:hypothetical protein
MNYYTYTIYFVDGYYYHGYHKHQGVDPLTDGYYGTPVTHKEKWLTTMHWKVITGLHESHSEVQFAEQEAIRPVFNTDPYCLNANCNGIIPPELASVGGKKSGKIRGEKHKQNKTAICDPVNQEKGRQTARERGSGFFDAEFQQSEMMQEIRRQNGKKVSQTEEAKQRLAAAREKIDPVKRRILARERALKLEAEGRGLGSIPYEIRAARSSITGKAVCTSKWMDPNHPELGVHNPGNLVKLQKRLGLPHGKENRKRIG